MDTLRRITLAAILCFTLLGAPVAAIATDQETGQKRGQHHLLDHKRIQALKERVTTLKERLREHREHQHGGGGGSDGSVAALQAQVTDLQEKVAALTAANTSMLSQLQSTLSELSLLQNRVTTLESGSGGGGSSSLLTELSKHLTFDQNVINGVKGPHLIFSGVNVHIRSGSGSTNDGGTLTGLGNLIVGYNEGPHPSGGRTGSHNIVGGTLNAFTSSGGLVMGTQNWINGSHATILGGGRNTADGFWSSILGGQNNSVGFAYQTIP